MTFKKNEGYVFPTVVVVLTLIVTLLTFSVSLQKTNIELIQNYKNKNIVEEEIHAIELVILDYLNSLFISSKDLSLSSDFVKEYQTPSNGNVKVKLKINDNCFNINSLVYKSSNNELVVSDLEYKRAKIIFQNNNINIQILNNIVDWLDENNINLKKEDEHNVYIENNINWRPRNNLAVTNEEILMIPGVQNYNDQLKNILCANIFSSKINIKNLSEQKLSMFIPFLSIENSKRLLSIIQKDVWTNSDQDKKTVNNIQNLKKEIEYVLGRGLTSSEGKFLKNISFNSKSVNATIIHKDLHEKQYFSFSKFEVDQDDKVKIIYRYGPFLKT